jgi:hypothetical protein
MTSSSYHELHLPRRINEEALRAVTTESSFPAMRDALRNSKTWREQMGVCLSQFRLQYPPVSFAKIGLIFGVNGGTISNQMDRFIEHGGEQGDIGRPKLLSRGQREEIFDLIIARYNKSNPLTMGEIVNHIAETYKVEIDRTTLAHIMSEDGRIKACTAVPMEDKRLEVTQEQIADYFAVLDRDVQGKPAHFVFNMDEMGHQEWADRKQKTVYVPAHHEGADIPVPVARCGKRITLVACIGLDGSYLKPMVIIPRKTVDPDLAPTGLTEEKVDIVHQPKGYINTQLFDQWFKEIFILELVHRRRHFGYDGEAILLLDGCSCHSSDKFRRLCEQHKVVAIFFPPHSSNQVQPLDLSVFGNTKKAIRRANRLEAVNIQTDHIVKVVNSFMAAATTCNVVGAFRRAGLVLFVEDDGRPYCRVSRFHAKALLKPMREALPTPEEEDESDIDSDALFEACQGLDFAAVFLGDFSDDDDNGAVSRRPRRQGRSQRRGPGTPQGGRLQFRNYWDLS